MEDVWSCVLTWLVVTTAHVLLDITSLRTDDHVSIMMSVLSVIMSARELKSASTLWAAITASLQPTVCISQLSMLSHDHVSQNAISVCFYQSVIGNSRMSHCFVGFF